MFSSQEEYSFSLTQLMVVLDKPIGLTLAPDPTTGHVYVQHIEAGMSAAESRLVLVSRGQLVIVCVHFCADVCVHCLCRGLLLTCVFGVLVVMDKPIGVTFAPDPTTGHVYVQHIEAGMSAAESRLALVSKEEFLQARQVISCY
jgi:hypothetical protein